MKPWTRLLVALLSGVVVLVALARLRSESAHEPLPSYWAAPDFALVDQTGSRLGKADLLGTVWVASFVFTNCADVCPGISARMARLAERLRRDGLLGRRVRLVSFTVDPERDTPEVLRRYSQSFGGLPASEWAFLTGADGEAVRSMIQEGFHLTAMRPEPAPPHAAHDAPAPATVPGPGYQVAHTPRVLLIDASGVVRGIYDALDDEAMGRIPSDARRLLTD